MIRLIGILVGSAIAIGLLIVTLGVPELATPEPVDGGLPATAPEPVGAGLPAPVAAKAPPTKTDVGVGVPATVAAEAPPTEADVGVGVPATELTDEQLVEQIFNPQPEPLMEEHWYAFWSPFRSEIAANGFVSRLQQTTGMDYRIVKLKPGVYEVAFAYTDEDDIEQKLARISAATGLDMSGS